MKQLPSGQDDAADKGAANTHSTQVRARPPSKDDLDSAPTASAAGIDLKNRDVDPLYSAKHRISASCFYTASGHFHPR